jgi:hypothetical protein
LGWTWINKSDWHPCSARLDYSYRQPKRWGTHNMWQSDSHVSRHHRGQILTEAGELNPKAITKCQPGLITSFKTNVNMSNYNSSCVCFEVGIWLCTVVWNYIETTISDLQGWKWYVCVQDLISLYFTEKTNVICI